MLGDNFSQAGLIRGTALGLGKTERERVEGLIKDKKGNSIELFDEEVDKFMHRISM